MSHRLTAHTPGWYWLRCPTYPPRVRAFELLHDGDWTSHAPWPERRESAEYMHAMGYRLASPHPIPGPEQLDALHALERLLDDAQSLAPDGRVILSVVLRDLRAALGGKP